MIYLSFEGISPLSLDLLASGGEIAGIFSGSIGIRCGDLIVTLQRENIPTPCGCGCAALFERGIPLSLGMPALCHRNHLILGSSVALSLQDAPLWRGMEEKPLSILSHSACQRACAAIGEVMRRKRREVGFSTLLGPLGWGAPAGTAPPFFRRAIPAIERMRQGIRRGDLTLLTGGAEALVGLGDGLTPSGDDLLTGLYATLRMRAGPEMAALIGRAIAQLPRLIRRTTPYGWSELWALTRGYLSEPLRTAIAALDAPDGGRPALLRLAGMGGSTGMDTLLGIGEAVQFLTDREDGKGSCTG